MTQRPLQGTLKRLFDFVGTMTQICVALVEETTAGMVARMTELAPVADLFEIRADRVHRPRPPHHPAGAHAAPRPHLPARVAGGSLGGRRPAPAPHPAGGGQARVRLRRRRAAQRLRRRDGREGRRGAHRLPPRRRGHARRPRRPVRGDDGRGGGHREDRGHAPVDRGRRAPARVRGASAGRRRHAPDRAGAGTAGYAHARPGRPLRRALHLRLCHQRGGVLARAAPGRGHGRPLPRAQRDRGDEGLRRARPRRAAQPVPGPAQPCPRGAWPRRRLRAPAGGGAAALHRGAARARPLRLQRDPARTRSRSFRTCRRWRSRPPCAGA